MKNSRSLKQSKLCFLRYFTERIWKLGKTGLQGEFELLPPEELMQFQFQWSYPLILGHTENLSWTDGSDTNSFKTAG